MYRGEREEERLPGIGSVDFRVFLWPILKRNRKINVFGHIIRILHRKGY